MDCASKPDGIAAGAGALPGARRRCEAGKRTHGPGPRACLALLAATALLALAAPAQAQTEVWSATLTPADLFAGNSGCGNTFTSARCSSTSILSEDSFNHDSTDYAVIRLFLRSSGRFDFEVDTAITTGTAALTLVVGSTSLVLADATDISTFRRRWNSSGVSLTIGTAIDVKLISLTAPGAPTGLAATANGPSRIDLAWTAPATTGGSAITGYKIEVSPDGSSWSDLVADTASTATAYAHMGLDPATTRHYRVSAINAVGTSDASDSDDTTTAPAQAQTEIWSATLTPADLSSGNSGCGNAFTSARCSSTSILSEDSFNHDSTDYAVTRLFLHSNGQFQFQVDTAITTGTAALTLVVGSTSLVLADATAIATSSRSWNSSGVSLTIGTAIDVKLITTTASTNTAPTVATAIPDQTATVGTAFSYAFPPATFTDADSDTLTYAAKKSDDSALPLWLSFAAATRTFSGTPQTADVGTVSVKVTASDGTDSVSDTFDIVVSAAAGVTVSKSALTVTEEDTTGNTYTVVLDTRPTADVTVTIFGHGGTDVTLTSFAFTSTTPSSATLTFTTAIGTGNWNQARTVTVKAGNDTDTANDTVTLTHFAASTDGNYDGITIGSVVVTVEDNDTANTAPTVATAILDQTATAGTAFSYAFPPATFTDADGDTLTYTATKPDDSALPSWLSFAALTRTFSGTPQAADVGTVSVKVTASDGTDSVSDTFDIVVSPPADTSPTLVSNAGQSPLGDRGHVEDRSQPFTTGAAGATLSSVEIISADAEGDDAAVSVCTVDSSNHPTSTCTALMAPSGFTAGTLVFTAPSNTTLTANTTYSLLVTSPGGESLRLSVISSDNEDAGGAMGWSIANNFFRKNSSNVWLIHSEIRSLKITIKGTLSSSTNTAPTVATRDPEPDGDVGHGVQL